MTNQQDMQRQYVKASYQRHKWRRLADKIRYREENPELLKERNRCYKALDASKKRAREYRKTYEPQYIAANRSKINAKNRRRKHRARSAQGTYTEEQLQARIDLYGRRCYLCGCDWDTLSAPDRTVDHVIPLSQGGTNWPANLRPACKSCNSGKHDIHPLRVAA